MAVDAWEQVAEHPMATAELPVYGPTNMQEYRTIERPVSQRKPINNKLLGGAASTDECIRVVSADDSPHVRKLMGLIFSIPTGYTVRFAQDGEDAWASMCAEPFDLLVTDIDMPRLNGIELVDRMRNHSFSQPVIFVSDSLPANAFRLFESFSPCDGLEKPFSFKDLLTKAATLTHWTQWKAPNGTNGNSHSGTNGNSHNGTNGNYASI